MLRFERRGFRKFGRPDIPKPINVGEEYDVEINEVGSKGDGIARIKNFVVFVPGVKKGDKVRVKIKEVRNRFAIGEKMETGEKESEEVAAEEAVEEVKEEAKEEPEEEKTEEEKPEEVKEEPAEEKVEPSEEEKEEEEKTEE